MQLNREFRWLRDFRSVILNLKLMMQTFREALLLDILTQPTAPFREKHVIDLISKTLMKAKIPFFPDPIGNLVVGVASEREYLELIKVKSTEPVRFIIAHLDHPGFHGTKWRSELELEFKWHGGSPTEDLVGSSVWLANSQGGLGQAEVIEAELHASGRAIVSGTVRLTEKIKLEATEIYGGFSFRAPVWKEQQIYYTKAADDLVGAFAILSVVMDFYEAKKKNLPLIGLLTRAEEVGFIGAIGHFELGWLKKARRPILGVSLETSRTLPGADIGKGPVVRLGDRYTVFDSGALRVFSDLAESVLPGAHQRRIMDGGTCEATAATVYGIPCVGISVPLGNYHNQCFEGGPDARKPLGPAPEFVHETDVRGLITLCHALLKPKLKWELPWEGKLKSFKKSLKDYRPLLKSGP